MAIAVVALLALTAVASAGAPPRVRDMSYFKRDDGSLPHVRLLIGVKRADTVRVATVFHGKHAKAPTSLDDRISGDPWVLQHKDGGRGVYKLLRKSLDERGSAAVRIRARNASGVDSVKLKIRLSECTMDPPFYPLDCEIQR